MITEGRVVSVVSPRGCSVMAFARNLRARKKGISGGNVVYAHIHMAAGMCGNYKAKKNDSGKRPLFQRTLYLSVFHLPLLRVSSRFFTEYKRV